ncbi:acid methyltransferase, putative [Ixodes scapularis]|uniref:Acid methyltransferase, putative n=1 Tax=Ixodes scapularis TaxID=6945 RepID=B7P991_IXOSC|nr:acid methyltransferase, putative [Ixodes scapularis]|eukprot:XP_002403765.1 acid methyltransferase, putative [Ixodes scapularis]
MANTKPTEYTLTPELYVNVTAAKWFSTSADVLRSVQGSFPSGPTEDQQFLDLGCGPGNITRDVLLPQCPPCRRLVAVDSSEDMLKYARERFSHPKIVYDTLDIVSDDLSEFVGRYGLFDRVYALHLLNWLKDQEQALKNIAKLMKPGGEALFTFSASTPQMRFRKKLAGMPRWSKYAKICENCTPPTVGLAGKEALVSYITGILKNANFTLSMCEVPSGPYELHGDLEHLIQDLLATNPIRAFLTKEEELLLLQDATEEAKRLWAGKDTDASLLAVSAYVVRASKPKL